MAQIILIASSILLLFFQVKLSRKEAWWMGLIMPLLSLGLSFISPVFMRNFLVTIPEAQPIFIAQMVQLTFLFANIPTGLCLLLYLFGRLHVRRQKQLNQMKIQDL